MPVILADDVYIDSAILMCILLYIFWIYLYTYIYIYIYIHTNVFLQRRLLQARRP